MDIKNYSVKEFCERVGISRSLFYKLSRDNKGPHTIKIGSRRLIAAEDARAWLNQTKNDELIH